ncbi:MAG: hypothetical protein V4547_17680 [Bacteroidota bacterium]
MEKSEVKKWVTIHKTQLAKAESALKKAVTPSEIKKAVGDIKYLKKALKNAEDLL